MSVRKAHNSGKNHLRNVVDYYQRKTKKRPFPPNTQWSEEETSSLARSCCSLGTRRLTRACLSIEIGHEKAQSVIDSITSSYAAEGQAHANPMLPHNQPGAGFPPPFGFPGTPKSLPSLLRHSSSSFTPCSILIC